MEKNNANKEKMEKPEVENKAINEETGCERREI